MTIYHDTYPAQVGSQVRDVPLIEVADEAAIAPAHDHRPGRPVHGAGGSRPR